MLNKYEGKVAVITGGARGFGKAFGEALSAQGATVVLIDVDEKNIFRIAHEIAAKTNGRCLGFYGDVTDDSQINTIFKSVADQFGGVDFLINNAGLHSHEYNQPMQKLGIGRVRRMFDVNVIGTVICTLAAVPFMSGREGANILNISSSAAYFGGSAYGASKLAVAGLTIAFANELGAEGVRVNAIAPGLILTDTIRAELPAEIVTKVTAAQYLSRSGEEWDVVEAMLYLTSERARFVTGEILRLSGGFSAGV